MSDESLPLPNSAVDAVDDAAPTERAPAVGAAPAAARMRGVALTLLWWRDDEREIAVEAPSESTRRRLG